ncbi:MAG: hypothetical protein AAFU49_11330 [Pseudomonadota bacterium]
MKRATTGLISLAILAATAGTFFTPSTAEAQMRCGKRDVVISHLTKKYGETQRSVGLQEGRGMVEIFANPDSGSWTILLTTPNGMSCLMAAGEAYEARERELAKTPA